MKYKQNLLNREFEAEVEFVSTFSECLPHIRVFWKNIIQFNWRSVCYIRQKKILSFQLRDWLSESPASVCLKIFFHSVCGKKLAFTVYTQCCREILDKNQQYTLYNNNTDRKYKIKNTKINI